MSGIRQVSEVSYDKTRNLRTCAATAKLANGAEPGFSFTTEWEDRKAGTFAVVLQAYKR